MIKVVRFHVKGRGFTLTGTCFYIIDQTWFHFKAIVFHDMKDMKKTKLGN